MNLQQCLKSSLIVILCFLLSAFAMGQASAIPSSQRINPEDLVKLLQQAPKPEPLLIHVGSHVLYEQAHIPHSEYIGPASSTTGLRELRKRVESLPRTKLIILYCGCCPWTRCPNEKPAYDALTAMGFRNLRVLYIADNFGTDWVDKGYPTEKGE